MFFGDNGTTKSFSFKILQQAYHGFIAGQIGMEPSTLNMPVPSSLAKETAWSLRNLAQIANVRKGDLARRTALCIAYVSNPSHFGPVRSAWERISSKVSIPLSTRSFILKFYLLPPFLTPSFLSNVTFPGNTSAFLGYRHAFFT